MTVFEIAGKPYAKKRPKFSRKIGRAYDPKENSSYEASVAALAVQHFPEPISGPIKLEILAVFQPAQSWSRKKVGEHLGKGHIQKPDADNLAKAVKDALNRIAWADDSQVCDMRVRKIWGPVAKTVVWVDAL